MPRIDGDEEPLTEEEEHLLQKFSLIRQKALKITSEHQQKVRRGARSGTHEAYTKPSPFVSPARDSNQAPASDDDEVQLTGMTGTLKTPDPLSPDVKPFPPGRSPPLPDASPSKSRAFSAFGKFGSPQSARQRDVSESSEKEPDAADSDEVQLVSSSGLRSQDVKPFERSRTDSGAAAGTGEAQSPSPADPKEKRSFNAVPPPPVQQRRPLPGAAGAAKRTGIAGPCVHVEGAGITEAAIRSAFEPFGPISDLKIDRKNPNVAYVTLADERSATAAIESLNRELLDDAVFITCKFAARQPGMFSFGGGGGRGRGGRPFGRGRGGGGGPYPSRGGPPRERFGLGFRSAAPAPASDAMDEPEQNAGGTYAFAEEQPAAEDTAAAEEESSANAAPEGDSSFGRRPHPREEHEAAEFGWAGAMARKRPRRDTAADPYEQYAGGGVVDAPPSVAMQPEEEDYGDNPYAMYASGPRETTDYNESSADDDPS